MPGSHSLSASALDFQCFFAHLLFASLQAPLDSGVGRSSSRFPWTSSLNLQRNLSDVKSSPRVSSRVNWFLSRAKPSKIQSLKINMFFNWCKCLEGAEKASSLDFERRRHSPWALVLPYSTWSELDSEVSLNFFWVRAWPWFEAVILLSLTGVGGREEGGREWGAALLVIGPLFPGNTFSSEGTHSSREWNNKLLWHISTTHALIL